MSRLLAFALFGAILSAAGAACSDDSGPRRVIQLTQADDGCSPASVDLHTGEAVTFVVKNEGKKDREVEGIDGTRLEELLVPSGRTREVDYDAPSKEGTGKVKCYIPGGSTTIIELNVSGAPAGSAKDAAGGPSEKSAKTDKAPNDTVTVKLVSFEVTADKLSVAAGPTKFVAVNASKTDIHELAVLRVKADGSYENAGEVEAIAPGTSAEVVLDLPKGKYLLACLIVPGEAGSKEDHFQSGMKRDFEVK
jgi:uncharacterized cupredoxin-like copper-binding protein